MNVREKLVELQLQADIADNISENGTQHREFIADLMIANGVTVRELDGCEHCRIASYTEKPFIVITQMGKEVKTQFNFCPNCGRRLHNPPKGE